MFRQQLVLKLMIAKITAQSQFPADLVTFTGEILNGKIHFLCGELAVLFTSGLRLLKTNTQVLLD